MKFLCTSRCMVKGKRRKQGVVYDYPENPNPKYFIPGDEYIPDRLIPTSLKDVGRPDLGISEEEYDLIATVRGAKLTVNELARVGVYVRKMKEQFVAADKKEPPGKKKGQSGSGKKKKT